VKVEAVIFDLDGVLVDSMPTHVRAWQAAFEKVAGISVTARDIYLLEGMRGMELIAKIFEQRGYQKDNDSIAKKIQDEKNRVFRSIRRSEPFDGVREMLEGIRCPKAVVSGSAKADVETILQDAFGKPELFATVITADDVKTGKPDPSAFLEAAARTRTSPQNALVVENAPLGAIAAARAGMQCCIVLNNTPLKISDFDVTRIAADRIFDTTGRGLAKTLMELCA
jgi:HAD superfamily hydrolase (TIGR01509 family)